VKPDRRYGAGGLCRVLLGICASVLCVVLTACMLPQPIGQVEETGDDVYTRLGRFALRMETTPGKQNAVQGGFAWRDDGRSLRLDLANPLGTTLLRVDADQDGAILTRANGTRTVAATPDELVAEALGSTIPVVGLRDWLRGRLAQGRAADVQRNDQGQPERFVQDGWQVRLSHYDEQGPRLLRFERREADDFIAVRLVID